MFNWFWKFIYGLIKVPLLCIDIVLMIARKLCGIDPIRVEIESGGEVFTQEVDLLSYFLQGNTVLNAFGYVSLFGFVLLFLFTIFRMIKDQANFYEKKSPVRICIDSAKVLLYFLLVPTIMILGSSFISVIMRGIYEATANGNSGLGGSMFVIFAEEAYIGPEVDKSTILNTFRTCSLEDYLSGANQFSYYNTDLVSQYFNLSEFNYFLGLVGSISVLILLSLTLLSFVERIISLVLLFVISPLPMSVSALDDGERFKIWREQTINKFITAYGGLLALNIFSLMLPMITSISFFSVGGGMENVANGIARLLFIIGGAFACRRGMVLIGNLVSRGAGSQDLMDQSHLLGDMASLAHMVGRVAGVGWNAVKGAVSGGVNTGRSWMQAADVPTSIAEMIRQDTQMKKDIASEERRAAENRYDSRLDRERDQGSNAIQNAMQGKSLANESSNAGINAPTSSSSGGDSTNNEKNNELNKSAQNDIKNVLQNNKAAQSADDSKSEK